MNCIRDYFVRVWIITLVLILMTGCSPEVFFKNPVPPNGEMLNEIPQDYCGLYHFESDSAMIIVKLDLIMVEYYLHIEHQR